MNKKLLTIGMAHYRDYDGVYFTIQALRMYYSHLMSQIEFVIIDNSPTDPASAAIQDLVAHINSGHGQKSATAKYVPFASPVGTSPARNEIFNQATGEYVLAMDCHVLLWPMALEALLTHYANNPKCDDIIQGPMFYDSMTTFTTHFNPVWRSEMFGVWSAAWQCKCKKFNFTFIEQGGAAMPVTLDMKMAPLTSCPHCEKQIPVLGWGGHEAQYEQLGFHRIINDSDAAFEIPGHGLGLFSARRESWLGFHPKARAFGGEELCIHEKYRQAGRKALCLPALKWLHRFGRPQGVPYPIPRYQKIRSYVLWFKSLGLDLQPIYDHFVPTGLMGEQGWQDLIKDPEAAEVEPGTSGCQTCGGAVVKPEFADIDDLYKTVELKPRDLNEHMAVMRQFASKSETVVELTARRESTIAFLAGRPKSVISYTTEAEGYTLKAAELVGATTQWGKRQFTMGDIVPDLPESDLLFIDTKHSYNHLRNELSTYHQRAKRFIILHDTVIYGTNGDDGGLGLVQAIHEFMNTFPKWKVLRQHNNQYGLTILGCQEQDYPQGPGTELHEMLHQIGITPPLTCECFQRMTQMNDWGVEGCKAHRDEIIAWMRDGQVHWGWRERMVAAGKAVFTGLALELGMVNWLDPFPRLVDLSIEHAEAKEAEEAKLEKTAGDSDLQADDMEVNEDAETRVGEDHDGLYDGEGADTTEGSK